MLRHPRDGWAEQNLCEGCGVSECVESRGTAREHPPTTPLRPRALGGGVAGSALVARPEPARSGREALLLVFASSLTTRTEPLTGSLPAYTFSRIGGKRAPFLRLVQISPQNGKDRGIFFVFSLLGTYHEWSTIVVLAIPLIRGKLYAHISW